MRASDRSPSPAVGGQRASRARGFTLIELVVALSVSAIVATFIVVFIAGPMQAYAAQTRRAALVDSADNVLRLMARDVRAALPNSVRILSNGNVRALELLDTVDAVRYRDTDATAAANDELDFTGPDSDFTTLGKFDVSRPFNSTTHYLSIYNVGIPGADAYELSNVLTAAGTQIQISDGAAGEDRVRLGTPARFLYGSPGQRIFLVSGPVTYLCDTGAREIRRYTGYSIEPAQTTSATALMSRGASAALVARGVTECNIDYAAGVAHRAGLVTLSLTIARNNERVRLLHQVHVENAP